MSSVYAEESGGSNIHGGFPPLAFEDATGDTVRPRVVKVDTYTDNGDGSITLSTGGGTGGSGHTIQDEGVNLAARTYLNFEGGQVAATDDVVNNATVITIKSEAGGGAETDPLSMHLDQTTPQTVSNGIPVFASGIDVTSQTVGYKIGGKTLITNPGTGNTFIGCEDTGNPAGNPNGITTAVGNVCLGTGVGSVMTNPQCDVLIGLDTAGAAVTPGNFDVMIGYSVGEWANGADYNVMIGTAVAPSLTGDENVLIGRASGSALTAASGNVFLGPYSGWRSTSSNTLIIDNQDRGSSSGEIANSLIYGNFNTTVANQFVNINGSSTVYGTATSSVVCLKGSAYNTYFDPGAGSSSVYYTLPVNAGTSGYQLTTDGSGNLSWQAAGGAAGATAQLDNLSTVAINTSLLPASTNSIDLGSSSKQWKDVYSAGTATGSVVDTQYLEYSGGGALTVRDPLTVNGNIETTNLSSPKTVQFTVATPASLDEKDYLAVWSNASTRAFNITSINAWSDKPIGNIILWTASNTGASRTQICDFSATTVGTNVYYGSTSTASSSVVATTNILQYDYVSGTPNYVKITINGNYQ